MIEKRLIPEFKHLVVSWNSAKKSKVTNEMREIGHCAVTEVWRRKRFKKEEAVNYAECR